MRMVMKQSCSVADGTGDTHIGEHHLRRREFDHVAVLLDTDETCMRRDQHKIIAAVAQAALRARELRRGAFGNRERDVVDQADLQPTINAVAPAWGNVEPTWSAGPLAPVLERRTARQPGILMNEDARRLRWIHLDVSPLRSGANSADNAELRAFDAAKREEVQTGRWPPVRLVGMRRRDGPGRHLGWAMCGRGRHCVLVAGATRTPNCYRPT
jgi:hypothetical protein